MDKIFGTYDNDTYDAYYKNVVNTLGFDQVRACIPFSDDDLRNAYAEDKSFNTQSTPIKKWDEAAGFTEKRNGDITIYSSSLQALLRKAGVKNVVPAQLVCILKAAARMAVERSEDHDREIS